MIHGSNEYEDYAIPLPREFAPRARRARLAEPLRGAGQEVPEPALRARGDDPGGATPPGVSAAPGAIRRKPRSFAPRCAATRRHAGRDARPETAGDRWDVPSAAAPDPRA